MRSDVIMWDTRVIILKLASDDGEKKSGHQVIKLRQGQAGCCLLKMRLCMRHVWQGFYYVLEFWET